MNEFNTTSHLTTSRHIVDLRTELTTERTFSAASEVEQGSIFKACNLIYRRCDMPLPFRPKEKTQGRIPIHKSSNSHTIRTQKNNIEKYFSIGISIIYIIGIQRSKNRLMQFCRMHCRRQRCPRTRLGVLRC